MFRLLLLSLLSMWIMMMVELGDGRWNCFSGCFVSALLFHPEQKWPLPPLVLRRHNPRVGVFGSVRGIS